MSKSLMIIDTPKNCEKCCYFGRAADAPETVEEDCMYIPSEEEDAEGYVDYTPPCERKEVWNG